MQSNEFKKYWPITAVILCGVLSIASAVYFMFVYVSWQKTNQKITPEVIEIKLPVMNWSQYSILSKKYEDDKVNQDINK